MIVKRGRKWCVLSEKTGRSFGCYATRKEAAHRMQQVEFFKHRAGGKSTGKKKRK